MNNWTSQILQSFKYGNTINPAYAIPRTLQYLIGFPTAPNCDYNFGADAVTHDPQILDLGLVIPYQWNIESVIIECTEAVAGVTSFNVAAGCTPACISILPTPLAGLGDTVLSGQLPPQNISNIRHFYFYGDPTTNTWDDMTAGVWQLTLLLNDYSKL